jgi:hypothetical protein
MMMSQILKEITKRDVLVVLQTFWGFATGIMMANKFSIYR